MILRLAFLLGWTLLIWYQDLVAQASPQWLVWGNFSGSIRFENNALPAATLDGQSGLGYFVWPSLALGVIGRLHTEPLTSYPSAYRRGELYGGLGVWGRYVLLRRSPWHLYVQGTPWVEHRRIWGFIQPPQGIEKIDRYEWIPFARIEAGVMLPLNPVLNLDLNLGWQAPLSASDFDVKAGGAFRVGLTGMIDSSSN